MKYSKTAPVKIIVLGAGGPGGYVVPHLYRLGYASEHPTRIIVCDGDVVEQKNLIRQNFVEQDIGRNKAQVLAERYAAAFGIECEYRPEFIETQEELYTLTEPDRVPYPMEPQRVILLGCVDNNKSRQLCHRVFEQKRNLIYIDAGNGEHTGQVVCGVRQNGRTLYKPVCSLYPDLLEDEDKFPSELSCAERAVSAPQSVTANLTAATAVVSFLYDLLIAGDLKTRYVTFSSRLISMRAEVVRQRPKKTTAKAAEQKGENDPYGCSSFYSKMLPARRRNAQPTNN